MLSDLINFPHSTEVKKDADSTKTKTAKEIKQIYLLSPVTLPFYLVKGVCKTKTKRIVMIQCTIRPIVHEQVPSYIQVYVRPQRKTLRINNQIDACIL